MPELPEVETIARTLETQIKGTYIENVEVCYPPSLEAGKSLLPVVRCAEICRVWRRAKLLLIDARLAENAMISANGSLLSNDLSDRTICFAFHLKMTGSFFLYPAGEAPHTHTRIIFHLGAKGELFFEDIRKFGYCRIMRKPDFALWPFWKALGPEPLTASIGVLVQQLRKKNTSIKAALLDQSIVAGVGNIYADETLFRARVHPQSKTSALSEKQLCDIAGSLQEVLQQAIADCGSSIRNYRDAHGAAGAFQNKFAVYGRKGQPCTQCGVALESLQVAGRTTVFCPQCQKLYL